MSKKVAAVLLLVLNLAPLIVSRYVVFDPVFAWRKGPLSFEKPAYPPPGTEVFALFLVVFMVDAYVIGAALLKGRRRPWMPIAAAALFFLVLEGGLRLYVRTHLQTPFRPSPVTFWEMQPDLRNYFNSTGSYTIDTDSNGFRGTRENARQAASGVYRIMAIGDSGPFGHGVNESETWQFKLEKQLSERFPQRKIEVINACCPGWTTWECIRFLEAKGLAFKPDLLIVGFNNDSGYDYEAENARETGGQSKIKGVLYESQVYLLLRRLLLESSMRVTADAAENAAPAPDRSKNLVQRVSRADFERNIGRIIELARSNGSALILVNNPVCLPVNAAFEAGTAHAPDQQDDLHKKAIDLSYRDALKKIADEAGVPLLNAHEMWKGRQDVVALFLPNDALHPNAAGHALLADEAAALIVEKGLVK